MLANLLKVGLGIAAGAMLSADTKKKIGDAARALAGDYTSLARKEADDIKRFWREEVAPILKGTDKGKGAEPPKPGEEGPKPPPEASA